MMTIDRAEQFFIDHKLPHDMDAIRDLADLTTVRRTFAKPVPLEFVPEDHGATAEESSVVPSQTAMEQAEKLVREWQQGAVQREWVDSLDKADLTRRVAEALEKERTEYRMDELDAVMYFVDKWFETGDPRLKDNPVTRASSAREIALKAIELSHPTDARVREAVEAFAEAVEFAKDSDWTPDMVTMQRWEEALAALRGAK